MKRNIRIAAICLSWMLVFAFAGCGDTYDSKSTETYDDTVNTDDIVYALDPDAFFGAEGIETDAGLEYYMYDDSRDIAEVYVREALLDDYDFSFISLESVETSYGEGIYFKLGYGEEATEAYITVYAYDNLNNDDDEDKELIIVERDSEMVQWVTPKGYESDINLSVTTESSGTTENSDTENSNTMELVAEPLDSMAVSMDDSCMMDLLYYAENELEFGASGNGSDGVNNRSYSGSKDDYDVIKAYVDMLCSEYSFELAADPYYEEYSSVVSFDFVLNYTGSAAMDDAMTTGTFSGSTGYVMIYGQSKRDSLKGYIYWNSGLTMVDSGYRYGSDSSSALTLVGDSAGAGLYRLADGSYKTTDGRLSAAVGETMMITDGTEMTYNARFVHNSDSSRKEVYVEDEYGTVWEEFYVPATQSLSSGQIFTEDTFIIEASYAQKNEGIYSSVPSYTWSNMFVCVHGNDYIIPIQGMNGEMTRMNIRVMYADDEEAVFYTCAQFESSPYEVEALIAVSVGSGSTTVENAPDEEYTIYVGESMDITGPSEFGAGYNLWTWSYIEGSQLSELSNTTSQTCTLKGKKAGDVRIQVVYEYSTEEADVLTGIARTVGKSKTLEYLIHIESK